MDFKRGERVNLDFETGAVEKLDPEFDHEPPVLTLPTFVGDILERDSSSTNPPVAPSLKANVNGFPAHRKRVPRVSAFKQQRAAREQQAVTESKAQDVSKPRNPENYADEERRAIDEENRKTLAAMSEDEIEQERQELLQNLNPALLQKLLMRSNIDDGSNERDIHSELPTALSQADDTTTARKSKPPSTKKVSFAAPEPEKNIPSQPTQTDTTSSQHPPQDSPLPSTPSTSTSQPSPPADPDQTPIPSLHYPPRPELPVLDPSSPTFLTSLHEKYFPDLPIQPNTQSWLSPLDPSDTNSPYHPSHTSFAASDLRFDFSGALLAPSEARTIPSDRGLHNHAAAPEAAGYTIPELAVLARSQVAAQRCVGYQTLGRILFRLGQGDFGVEKARTRVDGPVKVARDPDANGVGGGEGEDSGEDDEEGVGSAMAAGLWACMDEGRVVETLTEEANRERGHLTARTYAQEALWNWRRGGGRKRAAV